MNYNSQEDYTIKCGMSQYGQEVLMEHGQIVKTWCMYQDSHNGEEPPCISSCDEEGCEYALIMYEDGYSRYGNEK